MTAKRQRKQSSHTPVSELPLLASKRSSRHTIGGSNNGTIPVHVCCSGFRDWAAFNCLHTANALRRLLRNRAEAC
jgi:hypothetical protein